MGPKRAAKLLGEADAAKEHLAQVGGEHFKHLEFQGGSTVTPATQKFQATGSTTTKGLAFHVESSTTQKSFDGAFTLATGGSFVGLPAIVAKPAAAPPPTTTG